MPVDLLGQLGELPKGKSAVYIIEAVRELNQLDGYPNVIVVATNTKARPSPSFAKIEPSEANGLTRISFAICNQIQTIDKGRLKDFRRKISKEDVYRVKEALKVAMAIS